jgi:hypothetical protein
MGGGAAAEPSSAAATKRKRKSTVLYSPPEQLSSGRGGGWKGGGGGGAWLRRTLAEYEEVFRRHDKEAALEDEEYEVESVLASEVRPCHTFSPAPFLLRLWLRLRLLPVAWHLAPCGGCWHLMGHGGVWGAGERRRAALPRQVGGLSALGRDVGAC